MSTEPCRLLLISGSLRGGSTNTALLRTACEVAPEGIDTHLYEGMAGLPHFNPDDDAEGMPVHPAVAALRAAIHAGDALLLSTPKYARADFRAAGGGWRGSRTCCTCSRGTSRSTIRCGR